MIVKHDKVIYKDPLGNDVYFNDRSLGITILVPELSSNTSSLIKSAIEKPFIIVKEDGKRLYCSAKKSTGMYFFIAEVILTDDGWYVSGHRGEDNFEKLQDLFLRATKIYCATPLPYDASPIVKEDISQPDVLSYYSSGKTEMEQKSIGGKKGYLDSVNDAESDEDCVLAGDDEQDEDDYVDEDDGETLINESTKYTLTAIGNLLSEVIQGFTNYRLSYKDLPIVATMLKIIKDIESYTVNGYLYILLKEYSSPGNYRFNEIHLDDEGLKVTTGSYVTEGNYGGDSYSTLFFLLRTMPPR